MHEAAFAQGVYETAMLSLPPGNRITKFTLVAGVMSGVVKECLEFYLVELSRGTLAEGAALELRMETAKLTCRDCRASRKYHSCDPVEPECRKCGGANRLEGTSRVYLESIDVEPEEG